MRLSIITVCYNSAKYIRFAIDSVLSQSYTNIEYIIIDGGSTDGTLEILNEYADQVSFILSEPDDGIYDAMNKGISKASGEVVGILNSDDFYPHKHVIADVVNCFENKNDVDMVLGNVTFVNTTDLINPVRLYSSFRFSSWKLRFGFMPAHPASFIKKSAYNKVGLYKNGYKIAADFDIFVRMLLVYKLNYAKLDKTLVRMRLGGVSTSGLKSYIISTKEMLKSLRESKVYSNHLMILSRLPIKFFQLVFGKCNSYFAPYLGGILTKHQDKNKKNDK